MTSNALHNKTAEWISDGSEGTIVKGADGSITLASAKKGSPFNVRLPIDMLDNSYFEIKLTASPDDSSPAASVGVVHPSEFAPGYKCKGMFYNGNLTNGSAALATSWGPHLKKEGGDVVGIGVERDDAENNICVSFYLNGRWLGKGFVVTTDKVFQPCIHVSGTITATYSAPESVPSPESCPKEVPVGVEGDWKLQVAQDGGEALPIPDGRPITMSIEKEAETRHHVGIRVVNRMNGKLTMTPSGVSMGPMMCTMMAGPEPLMKIESLFSKSLPTIDSFVVNDSELELSVGGALVCSWIRYEKQVGGPLDKY